MMLLQSFNFLVVILMTVNSQSDSTLNQTRSNDSLYMAQTIVVTATKTNRRILQTPASVSIIGQQALETTCAKNIDDLLKSELSVQVRRNAGMGEGIPGDISIRGVSGSLGSSRTLVLVDGIPTNATGTPFLILNEIPIEAIERIEIVRGPFSSLYGSTALGGVINIISKKPVRKLTSEANIQTSYPFTALNNYIYHHKRITKILQESTRQSLWDIGGVTCSSVSNVSALACAGYRTIGNYLLRDSAIARKAKIVYSFSGDNHDYTDTRLYAKVLGYYSDKLSMAFYGRYFSSELGFGKTKDLKSPQDIETKGDKSLVGTTLTYTPSDKVTVSGVCYGRRLIGEFYNEAKTAKDTVASYWKTKSFDWQIQSQAIVKYGQFHTVITGIEFVRFTMDFSPVINVMTKEPLQNSVGSTKFLYNSALYFQDEVIALRDRLSIVPGCRIDYHSVFGPAFSPKLGISYVCTAIPLRFRCSGGSAFRAPTISELYLPDLAIRPDFMLKSNPLLKPEQLHAVDSGVESVLSSRVKLSAGIFYNAMRNLIQAAVTDSLRYVTLKNVSKAWTFGLESAATMVVREGIDVFTNITIQDSRDISYKVPLDYIPQTLINMGIMTDCFIQRFRIKTSSVLCLVGKRSYLDWPSSQLLSKDGQWIIYPPNITLPGYATVDVALSIQLLPRNIHVDLSAQNLFNQSFEESGGILSPGRFASLKLRFGF